MFAANPFTTEISSKNICEKCGRETSTRCGRCKVVFYCSSSCQKLDLKEHKGFCKKIAQLANVVEQEEGKLKSCIVEGRGNGEPENLFETASGAFGPYGLEETYKYISTRAELAKHCNTMVFTANRPIKSICEKAAFHFQEVLRLNANDDFSLHCSFPFTLINCDRIEDAYAFARYDAFLECNWDLHWGTKEGDWVYPKLEDGALYMDIFEEFPDDRRVSFSSLSDFVAILIIKLRLIADFDAKKKRGDDITEEEADKMRSIRKRQIPDLMDVIHEGNPTMLPALVNPGPLLCQPPPRMCASGKPSEAANVLIDAIGPFNRTPGAKKVLIKRFGPKPTYDSNCELFH